MSGGGPVSGGVPVASMPVERLLLGSVGLALFVLGVWAHRDRGALSVTLVVAAAVLLLLAVLLPRLQGLAGSVAGIDFQLSLASLPDAAVPAEAIGELRGRVVPESGSHAFDVMLREPGAATYAVVNLEDGRQWLTSRLLVFAVVLEELKHTECLVFTGWSGNDGADRLVGITSPADLRRAFTWEYPWLESGLAKAWEEIRSQDGYGTRALDASAANRLMQGTVRQLVAPTEAAVHAGHPDWTQIGQHTEHAQWVDARLLGSTLRGSLGHHRVTVRAVEEAEPNAVLGIPGRFVPLVDHGNRFLALVDRHAMLEDRAAR
ncbi:hypothetical protein [Streptomyces flaveus]|uniref:Uncharacterized protein n=1 Tax=Streptomyces flaveus TaxID=66370 RepID=A0A917RGH6_9ACTN|nr:hypothetical protein [Streptomyces flaveus]GGL05498.1 hypothetical protein GCM10010094_77850 [Streptomyces flaveus]